MLNQANTFNSGSYAGVRGRVIKCLQTAGINDHVFELIQAAYNSALADEGLVLSAIEKRRMLADVLKSVLDEMNRRLEKG